MFRTGDTVIFDPDSFRESLKPREIEMWYSRYYKSHNSKPKLFTFICEHHPQTGHCVLMDMNTGELLSMCHTNNFRLAADEEC